MDSFIAEAIPQQFQQPPTTSGLKAPLDWGIFISLLLLIVWVGFREILKSGNADQKVLESLIQDLRDNNNKNSEKLAQIAASMAAQESEKESVIFRIRTAEQKLDALHTRLDRADVPSSHPYQNSPQSKEES